MAGSGWRKDTALIEQLYAESYRFEFVQAVRLLEALAQHAAALADGAHAAREPVNFRSSLGAVFPASEIDLVTPGSGGRADQPPEMTVNFLGLGGGFGPLPRPFSDRVADRARRHDTAARDFLDIFNHRLVSLLYRVRQHHRAALSRGGPDLSDFARRLFSLIGMATNGLQGRLDGLPDRALLQFTGLLAIQPRSLHAVERAVAAHFGIAVNGEPLVGRWLPLGEDQETRLGPGGRNSRLGAGIVLGKRFWDQTAAIRLTLGPLKLADFLAFLPSGDAYRPLRALVDFICDRNVDCELRLLLAAPDVPGCRLSSQEGARVGWTSWLTTRPRTADAVVPLQSPQ
jgi:type VI secretion system protein ImpH